MHGWRIALSALVAMIALAASAPALADGQDSTPPLFGIWRNPKNSVHVDIRSCGPGACGRVVWANAKAQADAREGSGKNLVGLELFRDLKQDNDDVWRGKVFVPDLNHTFVGSAETIDYNTLRLKGCVFAGVLCKTQLWIRVAGQSRASG